MARKIYECALMLCFAFGHVSAECPDGWVTFRGSCYLFSHDAKTFTEAENFCIQHTSHLVHIETSQENTFVKSYCRELKTHVYWIGMTDADIEGIWKWVDGDEDVEFKDFGPGEPGMGNIENCGVFWPAFDFRWGDAPCTATCMPICEKRLVSTTEVIG